MDFENEYLKIANMTNKEAADIIRSLLINVIVGRGNGKTMTSLKCNTALNKAIKCLEEHPDTATDIVEQHHRELRASMHVIDEYAGVDMDADIVGSKVTFSPGTLHPSCYGIYDRVMMERQLQQFGQNKPLTEKEKEHYERYIDFFKPIETPHGSLKKWDTAIYGKFQLAGPDESMEKNPAGMKIDPDNFGAQQILGWDEFPTVTDATDDTSMHKGMNESHHDYCVRLSKILGMATDTSEEDAMARVEAFFKVFNGSPLINAMTPEDIKAGLEKEQKRQNGGEILPEKKEEEK